MASALSTIETKARRRLNEISASFWSSQDLIDLANLGIKDLWGAITDLHQEHYMTVDITNVSIAASAEVMAGVPSTVFRVLLIEPKTVSSSGSYRNLQFVPRDYNSVEFAGARTLGDVDPTNAQVIYYSISQAGAPVAAPTIHIGPSLTTAMAAGEIRLVYIPTIADVASGGNNPIPGESDNALIAWVIAFALASEREDRGPDPGWLAIYATEKQALLTRLTPRQEQEPEYVEAMFESLW